MKHTMFFGTAGWSAIWVMDPKQDKDMRFCSNCNYGHKFASGKLPDICPGCNVPIFQNRGLAKKIADAIQNDLI